MITPESLFDVYGNDDFRAFVLSTFMDNTTHLEKAIVFAVVADARERRSVRGRDHRQRCSKQRGMEVPLPTSTMPAATWSWPARCTSRGPPLPLCHARFPRMLSENYDVDYLFRKIQQEGIW